MSSYPQKTILILAANPKKTAQLRLDEEVREIEEGLRRSEKLSSFIIKSRWAKRTKDIQRTIFEEKPQIVHFSSHGAGENGIVCESVLWLAKPVGENALSEMFSLLAEQVECVLLNACHSQKQAYAIAEHIDTVIGMSQEVGERAALKFAIGFYDAVGKEQNYSFAYEQGCAAMAMGAKIEKSLTPVLLQKARPITNLEISPNVATVSDETTETKSARIFISYKRDVIPDQNIALELYQALEQEYDVAIDRKMLVGTGWQEWIETQLKKSDFLIVLLSETSVKSEMVMREVEKANKLAHQQNKPQILPVRLAYEQPLQYPLSEYLDPINWAVWQDDNDTSNLIAELQKAIAGEELPISPEEIKKKLIEPIQTEKFPAPTPMAQPTMAQTLEFPEGTIDLESNFYVTREEDAVALATIQQQGVTITIKGPRQMGKSSLLIRIMNAARELNKKAIFLDFQFFDKTALSDADLFYRQFCRWLSIKLRLPDQTEQWWQDFGLMGNPLTCTFYVQDYLLTKLNNPIVMAMDEVESMFGSPFRTDFFGMLRGWHNSRATEPIWKQLDLALVTSTEPYQLIEDLNQSPFNVGQVLELKDFSLEQMDDLNQRHDNPFSQVQLAQLMDLLHGHPYLVRKAMHLVASKRISVEDFFKRSSDEQGPFGDHLRYHLSRVYDHDNLINGLLQVFNTENCCDERVFFRLRGAGLIRREGRKVVPRCELYRLYFQEHLGG
ncbi:MAG: AAA-like domain-containing protein [Cyanobacteria bacterium P01_F01_bin.143]